MSSSAHLLKEDLGLNVDEGSSSSRMIRSWDLSSWTLRRGGADRHSAGSSDIIKAALSLTGSWSPCGSKTHQYKPVQQERRTIVEGK